MNSTFINFLEGEIKLDRQLKLKFSYCFNIKYYLPNKSYCLEINQDNSCRDKTIKIPGHEINVYYRYNKLYHITFKNKSNNKRFYLKEDKIFSINHEIGFPKDKFFDFKTHHVILN